MKTIELVIFDPDLGVIESLRRSLILPFLTVIQANGKQATSEASLDALWLTWMQAERFGITPMLGIHRAAISPTTASFIGKGFPYFVIAGVSLAKDESPYSIESLIVTIKAVAEAIAEDNARSRERIIQRVGTIRENLLLDRLTPAIVRIVLEEAWTVPPDFMRTLAVTLYIDIMQTVIIRIDASHERRTPPWVPEFRSL